MSSKSHLKALEVIQANQKPLNRCSGLLSWKDIWKRLNFLSSFIFWVYIYFHMPFHYCWKKLPRGELLILKKQSMELSDHAENLESVHMNTFLLVMSGKDLIMLRKQPRRALSFRPLLDVEVRYQSCVDFVGPKKAIQSQEKTQWLELLWLRKAEQPFWKAQGFGVASSILHLVCFSILLGYGKEICFICGTIPHWGCQPKMEDLLCFLSYFIIFALPSLQLWFHIVSDLSFYHLQNPIKRPISW